VTPPLLGELSDRTVFSLNIFFSSLMLDNFFLVVDEVSDRTVFSLDNIFFLVDVGARARACRIPLQSLSLPPPLSCSLVLSLWDRWHLALAAAYGRRVEDDR
jgi:hypothetical protein